MHKQMENVTKKVNKFQIQYYIHLDPSIWPYFLAGYRVQQKNKQTNI